MYISTCFYFKKMSYSRAFLSHYHKIRRIYKDNFYKILSCQSNFDTRASDWFFLSYLLSNYYCNPENCCSDNCLVRHWQNWLLFESALAWENSMRANYASISSMAFFLYKVFIRLNFGYALQIYTTRLRWNSSHS